MTILRASLSVVGLMIWDNTLFDNFNVPTGMDKNLAVNEILRKCGDLELMWPDWDFMQFAIGNWSDKNAQAWADLYASTQLSYDPIANVDAVETTTRNGKNGGSVTSTNKVTAYNDNTLNPESENVTKPATNWNDFEKKERHGNIGVTSTQQLIREQREVVNYNVYDVITESFKQEFCLMCYA